MNAHEVGNSLSLLTTRTFAGRRCDFGTTAPAVSSEVDPSLRLIIENTVRATLAAIRRAELADRESESDPDSDESDLESD
jgi:hypothetical protein